MDGIQRRSRILPFFQTVWECLGFKVSDTGLVRVKLSRIRLGWCPLPPAPRLPVQLQPGCKDGPRSFSTIALECFGW